MSQADLFAEVLDPVSRANPYPLYARLRETPVSRQADGAHVVSTYREVVQLLHDPRISSDDRRAGPGGRQPPLGSALPNPPFIFLDPPDHDRLRGIAMASFGPPHAPARVDGMRGRIREIVGRLLDAQRGRRRLDVVASLAFPVPVTVVCEMLGVPAEDESGFHAWVDTLAGSVDPGFGMAEGTAEAAEQMARYIGDLVAARRRQPRDDLLSGLVRGGGAGAGMEDREAISTAILLLVAGHETTVNLIANGVLTLLHNPGTLDRLRRDPDLMIPTIEELLRYEPPVQFRTRLALADIEIAGEVIPRGAPVVLLLAAANRDPSRFPDPDRFDPDRRDNQHLGFGGGIHYCFGAALARTEAAIVLSELVRRLQGPRLTADPPPYRRNAALRGPQRLVVEFERLAD